MAESFLVEFRLRGYSSEYAQWASARVLRKAKSFGIRKLSGQHFVSHITLFGNAKTNNLKQVTNRIERIRKYYLIEQPNTMIPFKIKGIGNFNNMNKQVIYLDVDPSPQLEQFRWELAQSLTNVSFDYAPWDTTKKYEFHSTLGIFQPVNNGKFNQLCDYAGTKCSLIAFKQHKMSIVSRLFDIIKKYTSGSHDYDPGINQHLIRITVLKGSRIHCEYDLVLKKLLSRRQALRGYLLKQTIQKLGKIQAT